MKSSELLTGETILKENGVIGLVLAIAGTSIWNVLKKNKTTDILRTRHKTVTNNLNLVRVMVSEFTIFFPEVGVTIHVNPVSQSMVYRRLCRRHRNNSNATSRQIPQKTGPKPGRV